MTDEMPHRRWPALVVATAAILALVGVVIALIALSQHVDFTFGSTDGTGATKVSIPLLFFGAVEGTFLYASMVAMAVESAEVRQRLSRIFWPIFAVKVTLALTVAFSAVQGFDLLAHNFRPHWHILYSPSLRVVQDVLLLSTFLALTWLHAVLLHGRGWSKGRVALLIAFMVTLTLIATVIAIEIARSVA